MNKVDEILIKFTLELPISWVFPIPRWSKQTFSLHVGNCLKSKLKFLCKYLVLYVFLRVLKQMYGFCMFYELSTEHSKHLNHSFDISHFHK